MTVYVVQEPARRVTKADVGTGRFRESALGSWTPLFDVTPALKFGTLQVLIDQGPIGIAYQRIVRDLKIKLKNFCDDDYILSTGDPAAIGITIALAARQNKGRVRVLRWDKTQRGYVEVRVDLEA